MTKYEKSKILGGLVQEWSDLRQERAYCRKRALELARVFSSLSDEPEKSTELDSDIDTSVLDVEFNLGEGAELLRELNRLNLEIIGIQEKVRRLGVDLTN
ncbi:MAG: hypothetical protein OXT71_18630 [Acidobacteriota bacterium]|nr:hypothetical protein [Acidobacteriota bacterium]